MNTTFGTTTTGPRGARLVLQVVGTLAVLAGMAAWGLTALLLFALQCDDGCSPGYDHGPYIAQGVVAAVGIAIGFVGLVLGFTHYRIVFWNALAVSALIGLCWTSWVLGGGF